MSNSIIIDIETLGHAEDTIITEIAAVAFDREIYDRETYRNVDTIILHPCCWTQLCDGRTWDAKTIQFHKEQGTLPTHTQETQAPRDVPIALADFFTAHKPVRVWIQGMDFDRPKIENFSRHYANLPLPWNYGITRDARTIYDTAFGEKSPKGNHRSLDDCYNTLANIRKALEEINRTHRI